MTSITTIIIIIVIITSIITSIITITSIMNVMIVINAGQLHWTTNMEREMAAHGAKGVQIELDRELQQLDDIIALVRGGKLSKNQKTAIGALTVMDVHARDVVKNMVAQGVSNKNDFLWFTIHIFSNVFSGSLYRGFSCSTKTMG